MRGVPACRAPLFFIMESVPSLPSENRLHFLDYWRIIRVRKLVILAVFLLVVTTATVVTFWLPKTYASKARMLVGKDQRNASFQNEIQQPFDYNFIQTQFEVIQSKMILDQVITNLALGEVWAKRYGRPVPYTVQETLELLEDRMDLRQVRNTSYIEIRVFSEIPEEAAQIANLIADVYKKHRESQLSDKTQSGIRVFEQRLAEQRQIVTNLQNKVDSLRQELKIDDAFAVNDQYVSPLNTEAVRKKMIDKTTAHNEYLTAENKLKQIEGRTVKELRFILPTIHPDQNLPLLLQNRALLAQKISENRVDFTDENPEMKRLKDAFEKVEEQIDEMVTGIRKGLTAQRDAAKATYDTLSSELEKAQEEDRRLAGVSRPYFEAKQELKAQRDILDRLESKVLIETVEQQIPSEYMVEITDRAGVAVKPVRPNVPLNIAASIVVGLIAGIGLAFFIEYLDTSVKTIDDIEQVLQSPVLSVIPQGTGPLIDEGQESPHAEAYRVLRTNILFGRKSEGMNTMTVVSGGAAEGKSTTILNLAIVLAQNGARVLLVDTDLRRPSLHKALKTSNSVGMTNYLLKQNTLEEVIQTTPVAGLDFLPSGKLPSSSLGILNSPHFHEFVQEVKKRYDFVLLDSPPILGVSDASILVREVEMTLLVVQHRKYPQAMNVRAKQTIDKFGGNLLGVVLNNINLSTDSYYYYYSGYGYGYTNQNQADEDKPNGVHKKSAEDSDKVPLKRKY